MIYAFLAILGLVFGSFYLVVATRLPEEKSIIKPGSHCDNCNHALKWYELIPVLSYILQKGKCRSCGAKIPFLTVIIEIITGIIFVLPYYLYGLDYKFFAAVIILSLTIIIFISDFKYYIINDSPLFTAIIFILILKLYFFNYKVMIHSAVSGLIMFGLFLLIKFLGDRIFKKESLGGGDIKLAILLGVALNLKLGLAAFILSAFIAFPYALFVSIFKKEGIVPYGPFIIAALVIVFMFESQTLQLVNDLFYL
ncbi:MAG: prepilin peptidase [Bacilli bacterium]|nr:prepilin peptidase [Bacilli bacterium]